MEESKTQDLRAKIPREKRGGDGVDDLQRSRVKVSTRFRVEGKLVPVSAYVHSDCHSVSYLQDLSLVDRDELPLERLQNSRVVE